MKSHVLGRICITPRASAEETRPLSNPLSCVATASASDGETFSEAAMSPTCAGDTVSLVGTGASPVEPPLAEPPPPPPGIVNVVPATSVPSAFRPFAAARSSVERPSAAATPDSVSPGCTT